MTDKPQKSSDKQIGVQPIVVQSLADAIDKEVVCTDGDTRILRRFDDKLGYYDVPITDTAWMSLSGTYLWECKRLFVNGKIVNSSPTVERVV